MILWSILLYWCIVFDLVKINKVTNLFPKNNEELFPGLSFLK